MINTISWLQFFRTMVIVWHLLPGTAGLLSKRIIAVVEGKKKVSQATAVCMSRCRAGKPSAFNLDSGHVFKMILK